MTLELVKFFQAVFIQFDYHLYDTVADSPASVQASNLNEELGQVSHLFSDKTGTMTCNIMQFRMFSAGKEAYGMSTRESIRQTLEKKKKMGSSVVGDEDEIEEFED